MGVEPVTSTHITQSFNQCTMHTTFDGDSTQYGFGLMPWLTQGADPSRAHGLFKVQAYLEVGTRYKWTRGNMKYKEGTVHWFVCQGGQESWCCLDLHALEH
jgi:hypothetical protein